MQNNTIFTAEQYYQGLITLSLLNKVAFERLTEITRLDNEDADAFDEEHLIGNITDEEAAVYIAELQTDSYIDNGQDDREFMESWSNQLLRALITARSEKDDAERKANSDAVQALYK